MLELQKVGDLLGLLEILDDHGRAVDIARLDDSLDEERVTLLNLLEDTESLGLVNVENGDVSLTLLGKKFLNSNMDERRDILRKQIVSVEPFRTLMKSVSTLESRTVHRDWLIDFIRDNFPSEHEEDTFGMVINWGRYTKLIEYDSDEEEVVFL